MVGIARQSFASPSLRLPASGRFLAGAQARLEVHALAQAAAMNAAGLRDPLPSYGSYGSLMPHFRSAASLLSHGVNVSTCAPRSLHTLVVFKAARSGSTMFADVATKLINATGLRCRAHFEPFCRASCLNTSRAAAEAAFGFLLSSCDYEYATWPPSMCDPVPQSGCGVGVAVSITVLNPRFSHRARWTTLAPRVLPASSSVIINLRRTNLVAMALSKMRHGGCDAFGRSNMSVLLRCVWHFAVGDQEYASAVALQAAAASGAVLYLYVYEDILADPVGMQQQLALDLIGRAPSQFVEGAVRRGTKLGRTPKLPHPVDDRLAMPRAAEHPCLARQLMAASHEAFTVPRANGAIDIAGECGVMPPLARGQRRSLRDLYSPPSPPPSPRRRRSRGRVRLGR